MSYLLKYTGTGVELPVRPGQPVYWQNGETRWVDNESYSKYSDHATFTVLDGPDLTEYRHRASHTVVAGDVTAGAITFSIPFTATGFILQVFGATGLQKAITDLVTIVDGDIILTADGATTFAATDVVHLIAWA